MASTDRACLPPLSGHLKVNGRVVRELYHTNIMYWPQRNCCNPLLRQLKRPRVIHAGLCLLLFRIDGSAMDYDDNVRWTSLMAAKAHEAGAVVEAELGRLAGEEDGMSVPEVEARMTDPAQVRC